jgi:hypothetical protein
MLNTSGTGFVYGIPSERSYFSPVTPTPGNMFTGMGVYEPSADWAYTPTTFGAFPSLNLNDVSSEGLGSGVTSPRQIGGPVSVSGEGYSSADTFFTSSPSHLKASAAA